MDKIEQLPLSTYFFAIRKYWSLTKPGIIMGNAITAAGGFVLAAKGHIDPQLFLFTLLGLCLIIASGCVFNNFIDRKADAQMKRTKNRVLAQEGIAPHRALIFACLLGFFGACVLALFSSSWALSIALLGLFIYVFAYSFLKYRTLYA